MFDGDAAGAGSELLPGRVLEGFEQFEAGVRRFHEADPSSWSNQQRLAFLARKEQLIRALQSFDPTIVNQLEEQFAARDAGCKSTAELLANGLRISDHEARGRVKTAELLGDRTQVNGQIIAPRLAAAAEALGSGALGGGHVEVLKDFERDTPNKISFDVREEARGLLVQHALGLRPDQLKRIAQRMLAILDPDCETVLCRRAA